MSTKEEKTALVEFATNIARESGEIAMKYFRSDLEVSDKGDKTKFDPLTRADTEIEAFLREKIQEAYPDHGIIGEEAGVSEGRGQFKWLIDPIDGTRGFVAGSPMWGTLLGCMEGEECIAGVMNQPFVGETFVGGADGAFLVSGKEKKQIHTSEKQELSDAILCCTHLSMFHTGKALDRFVHIAETCRFSRFGTDCYGYALLAYGSIDLVVEGALKSYDIMPLIPVVEAAGGIVTNWEGGPVADGGDVVAAANPVLHAQALKLLSE